MRVAAEIIGINGTFAPLYVQIGRAKHITGDAVIRIIDMRDLYASTGTLYFASTYTPPDAPGSNRSDKGEAE